MARAATLRGRIGYSQSGYQQRQNGFAQAGYPQDAPAQTKRQIFPSGEHRMQQRREAPPSRLLAAWRRFPRAGQLPKQLLWEHKLACHASPHAAEDGSWTCPTCGDCFDDSDVDQ